MKPTQHLFDVTFNKKIPLLCTFELTKKCNLNCVHCYIPKDRRKEITTKNIKETLIELKKTGCIYLVFTGGEIFLRKDIFELIAFARKLKFDLRLFSNGTLINKTTAKRLSKYFLSAVEVSLYGKEPTHDKITGVPGSFKKTINTISFLKTNNIPVSIKCPVMSLNINDISWLKKLSKTNNLKLKLDPTLSPKTDGSKDNLKYRPNLNQLKKLYKTCSFKTLPDNLTDELLCSAGHNLTGIDSYGNIYPCLQVPYLLGNTNDSFRKVWNNTKTQKYRSIKLSNIQVCKSCSFSSTCQRCPGMALLEDGSLFGPSKTACELAEIQAKTDCA